MKSKPVLYVMIIVLCIGLLGPAISILKPAPEDDPLAQPQQQLPTQPPTVFTTVEEYTGSTTATVETKDKVLVAFPSRALSGPDKETLEAIQGVEQVVVGNPTTIYIDSANSAERIAYLADHLLPKAFAVVLSKATVVLPSGVALSDSAGKERIIEITGPEQAFVYPYHNQQDNVLVNTRALFSQGKLSSLDILAVNTGYAYSSQPVELAKEVTITKILRSGVKKKIPKQLEIKMGELNTEHTRANIIETADLLKLDAANKTKALLEESNISFVEAEATLSIPSKFSKSLESLGLEYREPMNFLVVEVDAGFDFPETPGTLFEEYVICEVKLPELDDYDLTSFTPWVGELPKGTTQGVSRATITLTIVFDIVQGVDVKLEA